MAEIKSKLKNHWGFAILSLVSLLSLIKLLLQKVPGHYRVFTGAGRALWNGRDPYGSSFDTGVGYYFYSPTCALTVFGPLSHLPEKLGLVVYMAGSWALFAWGARKLANAFALSPARMQWFWALIAAQMAGGILASKLEVAIVGLMMGAVAMLADSGGPRGLISSRGLPGAADRPEPTSLALPRPTSTFKPIALAALILAAILNWKFQPLPVVGLIVLARLITLRDWRFPLLLLASLAFWSALPYLFFAPDFVATIHQHWNTTFTAFVRESVLNFENVFAMVRRVFNLVLTFEVTQLISVAAGVALAAVVAARALNVIHRREDDLARRDTELLALALGTMFVTAFSPLGQNNALILYAPLLMTALIRLDQAKSSRDQKIWRWVLGIACAVMILAYSDLVPKSLQGTLRALSVKSLACLGLGAAIAAIKSEREPTQSPPAPRAPT